MNNLLKIFPIVSCIFLIGCSSDNLQEPNTEPCASRAITPGINSETNPDLLSDWENCDFITLNDATREKVTPPWKDGAASAMEGDFAYDIRRHDGWTMLFHTFCRTNTDVGLKYMCFYNKFTGFIKLFYYADEQDAGEHTLWNISTANGNSPQVLFGEYEFFSQPIGDTSYSTIWSITEDNRRKNISGISKGWNGFEFRIGEYHQSFSSAPIILQAYNTMYTDFSFNGDIDAETSGTITTINTSEKSIMDDTWAKGISNAAGEKVKDVVDNVAGKILNTKVLGLNVADLIKNVGIGDYASAIRNGLGLLFKSFSKTKTDYSLSKVSLQTQGKVKLTGIASTGICSTVVPITIDLEEILNSNSRATRDISTISQLSNSPIELGVWNLKNKPTIYYDRYTEFSNISGIPDYDAPLYEFNGLVNYPDTYVGDIEIVFNPAIKPYVKTYEVTLGMVDVYGGNRNIVLKNSPVIHPNGTKSIYSQDNIYVYGVVADTKSLDGTIENFSLNLNDDTKYYIDWGNDVQGYRAAVVGLTWTIEYEGEVQTFSETRKYDVVYKPSPNSKKLSVVNNPPYTYVLNQGSYYGFDLAR